MTLYRISSGLARPFLFASLAIGVITVGSAAETENSISRKPLPDGVIETKGVISSRGGIVQLKNGSLMLASGKTCRLSLDTGRTWSEEKRLECDLEISGMIRLQSDELAVYGQDDVGLNYFASSADDGKTWSKPVLISDYPDITPLFHSMIQLSNGRLLFTGYWHGLYSWQSTDEGLRSVHPDLEYEDVSAYGLWRGQKIQVEGHGHGPEMGICIVFRSDDQGQTWQKHPGGIMGWFDFEGIPNGNGGQTACFEPTIAETRDGNVLFIARSTVGRLVQTFSTDQGEHFYAVKPSELSSSESPAVMVTLPKTKDLLIVWNQLSREEIRRGYRRGRLSSAVSTDGGHSWGHFKTLELSEGLEDNDRVTPEFPIKMVRARQWVGALPDRWAFFHYPNLDIIGDQVILRYRRGSPYLGIAEQKLKKQDKILRIYPIEWFYR